MASDNDLLRAYAEDGHQAAFAEVVRRHVDFVYSAALRLVAGDTHLAQDVAQSVFTDLARKARSLSRHATLIGWLHTSTRFAAAMAVRGERRRFAREQQAAAMHESNAAPNQDWEALRPLLDEAVGRLNARDREAVLLRFFESKSHREIGAALGLKEDAARMRVDRALEKLRGDFGHRGVTLSSTLLATAISTHSVQAAPTGLASSVAEAARAGVTGAGPNMRPLFSGPSAALISAAVLVALIPPLAWQFKQNDQLREANATFLQANARLQSSSPTTAAGVAKSSSDADIETAVRNTLTSMWGAVFYLPTSLAHQYWQNFLLSLPPSDLPRVAETIKKLSDPLHRDIFYQNLMPFWAETDAPGALAYVQSLPPGFDRDHILADLASGLAAKNAPQAFAWAEQIVDTTWRGQAMQGILEQFAKTDPAAALAFVPKIPIARTRLDALQSIFHAWANRDQDTAIAQAAALPTESQRLAAQTGVAEALAVHDSAAALTWAATLPESYVCTTITQNLIKTWAETDPKGVGAWVDQQPDSVAKQSARFFLVAAWAGTHPTDALAYVQSLPDDDEKFALFGDIVDNWVYQNPAAAAHFVATQTNEDFRVRAAKAVATMWYGEDKSATVAWVKSLPDDPGRTSAVKAIISGWSADDPDDVTQWLDTLPPGPSLDSCIYAYLEPYRIIGNKKDPALAAPWVDKITSDKTRNRLIEIIGGQWLKSDPDDATAWIQQSTLPDDRKEKLLNPAPAR